MKHLKKSAYPASYRNSSRVLVYLASKKNMFGQKQMRITGLAHEIILM